MTRIARAMIVFGALGLSACTGLDAVSRNAPYETLPDTLPAAPAGYQTVAYPGAFPEADLPPAPERAASATLDYRIGRVTFVSPEGLAVSEANLYYPVADIVWRGDPLGDRPAQVGAIFREAVKRARPHVQGSRTVDVEITLRRFHSVTEKTRYTVGGVHSIDFDLILRDPATGRAMGGVGRTIKADLDAYGGKRAMAADAQGLTMKERIIRHLQTVFTAELTHPDGFIAAQKALDRAIDQI